MKQNSLLKKVFMLLMLFSVMFTVQFVRIYADVPEPFDTRYINVEIPNLQYNTNAIWASNYYQFNCYGYALGRYGDYYTLGYYSGLANSSLSKQGKVIADLQALGYYSVREVNQHYRPTSSSQYLLAFAFGSGDFHVMRYDRATGSWYHKVGALSIQKSILGPQYANSWKIEFLEGNTYYKSMERPDGLYQAGYSLSTVFYIAYDTILPGGPGGPPEELY